jgi:hypothetical protein
MPHNRQLLAELRGGVPLRSPIKNRSRAFAGPRSKSRGQSLVEFALFIPVLLVILVIAVDLGRIYLGWVTLNNLTRIGANFAATNPTAWQSPGNAPAQSRYQTLMMNDAGSIDCTLPGSLPAPAFPDGYAVGGRATVSLQCEFHLITPMLNALIGDGAGNVAVSAATTFGIRASYAGTDPIGGTGGGGPSAEPSSVPSAPPTASPTPTPTETPTPTPTPGGSPSGSEPPATPTPTPTVPPPIVTFYGTPDGVDSYGGAAPTTPPNPSENQIVGIPGLNVTFTNTTPGGHSSCLWEFGDGGTSTSCGTNVSYTYPSTTARTTYDVSLTIDGGNLTRVAYVLISCKVPAFSGVHTSQAVSTWTGAGFTGSISVNNNGNSKLTQQSLAGGLVNPPGGCSGATISVQ